MLKHNMIKTFAVIIVACCLILSVSCKENKNETSSKPDPTSKTEVSSTVSEDIFEKSEEADVSEPSKDNGIIKKITGASDDVGIYAIVITLSDNIPDKGVVEMVYYGPKGKPEENSIVNTYSIEYYKDDNGKYEIKTFYNGNIDQSFHQQNEVKANNTFPAMVRAGRVIISFTPDGGEKNEIYSAESEQFYVPD